MSIMFFLFTTVYPLSPYCVFPSIAFSTTIIVLIYDCRIIFLGLPCMYQASFYFLFLLQLSYQFPTSVQVLCNLYISICAFFFFLPIGSLHLRRSVRKWRVQSLLGVKNKHLYSHFLVLVGSVFSTLWCYHWRCVLDGNVFSCRH